MLYGMLGKVMCYCKEVITSWDKGYEEKFGVWVKGILRSTVGHTT